MTDETYNGWTNRETWAFNLHWANDEGLYRSVCEYAAGLLKADGEIEDYRLGESVVGYVRNDLLPMADEKLGQMVRDEVGSWWRIDLTETGASVREHATET